jgi:hypothetical protein
LRNYALEKPADRLLFVLALLLIFLISARAPVDTDMYWALRVGKEIVTQGEFIHTDPITYTHAGDAWVSHSWLFDVLLYGIFSWLSYHGLTLLVALLASATMGVMWFQLSGSAIFRTVILVFAALVAAPTWTPRPQMVSMLFLCLTYLILFLYRGSKERRLLYFLPLMMILWANLHGGYILGLIAIGIMIAGEIGDHLLLNITEKSLHWLQIRDLTFVFVLCVLATLITPYGFGTWEISFSTFNMQVNDLISEWQSPNFHLGVVLPYFISILMLVGILALSKKKLPVWGALTLVIFLYFSLSSRRQIGAYAIAVMPILGRNLWALFVDWWQAVRSYLKETHAKRLEWIEKITTPKPAKENKWINLLVAAIFAFVSWGKLIYVSLPPLVETDLNPTMFPVEAVEVLQTTTEKEGQLFNEYDWGGYLSWWAPDIPVYIDARADLFGDEFIFHWNDICEGTADWKTEFERWGITKVLVSPSRPLSRELQLQPDWEMVYADDVAVLFIKKY